MTPPPTTASVAKVSVRREVLFEELSYHRQMKRVLGTAFALWLLWPIACGSNSSDGTGGAGGNDAGTDAASDASSDAQVPGESCEKTGGMCGCAGSCNPGYHPATGTLLMACPQPCDTCGACSQQCCLPD